MQDKIKTPHNEKGQPHGYWENVFTKGGWYKGHFVNGETKGYFKINWWGTDKIHYDYYAR